MMREDVVAEARKWLGTPFHHQQSRRGIGCDCIGLVGGVALALGIPEAARWATDTRWKGYGRTPDPEMLTAACDELLDRILVSDVGVGDILVMRFDRDPQHFALMSSRDPAYIIHAYTQAGKVVEHILDAKWRRRIVRAYRFR